MCSKLRQRCEENNTTGFSKIVPEEAVALTRPPKELTACSANINIYTDTIWGVIQKDDVKFVRTGEIVFSQFGQSFKTSWTSWKSWTCCLLLFSTKTRAMTLSSPHDSFFYLLAKIGRFRLWPYLPGFKSTGRHWRAAPLLDTLAQ